MSDYNENVIYDEEGINYDDIPEITDFSKGRKNPFAGKIQERLYNNSRTRKPRRNN